MLKIISLRDFFLTGEFGGIQEDTHPDQVINHLGQPTQRYVESDGLTFFLYGTYEIAFFDNVVMYIQNHSMHGNRSDRHFQNQLIQVDPWIFDCPDPLTKQEIITALSANKVVYRHVTYFDRKVLELDSGVVLDFNPSLSDPTKIVCDAVTLTFPAFRQTSNGNKG